MFVESKQDLELIFQLWSISEQMVPVFDLYIQLDFRQLLLLAEEQRKWCS